MNKKLLTTLCLSFVAVCYTTAQSRILPILENNTDVRTAAMGNTQLGQAHDMYIYSNPASFSFNEERFSADVSTQLFPKSEEGRLQQYNFGAAYKLQKHSALMAGFRYQTGLSIPSMGVENGKSLYKPYELSLDLGYSFAVTPNIGVYATATYARSSDATKTEAWVFSVGTSYFKNVNLTASIPTTLTFGARLLDFGKPVKYNNTGLPYSLPTSMLVGGDWKVNLSKKHSVTYALSCRYFTPQDAHETWVGTGLEYTYNDMCSARIGYHHSDKASDALTFGVGGKYAGVKLNVAYNYAFKNYGVDALLVGLGYNF